MDPTGGYGYDEVHPRIMRSIESMRTTAARVKQLEQCAVTYHNKLKETGNAADAFFGCVKAISQAASTNPAMSSLGHGFSAVAGCANTLHQMQQEYLRSIAESIILPISNNISSDARNLTRMEKEYQKYSKQYTEEVNRARKELDKVAEKTKKMVLNGYTTTNLSAMQQQLQDRVADLESLRMHMLKQVMIEERRRLIVILIGLLDTVKVQRAFSRQSLTPLNSCLATAMPLTANPEKLPDDFMASRGARMDRQPGPGGRGSMAFPGSPGPRGSGGMGGFGFDAQSSPAYAGRGAFDQQSQFGGRSAVGSPFGGAASMAGGLTGRGGAQFRHEHGMGGRVNRTPRSAPRPTPMQPSGPPPGHRPQLPSAASVALPVDHHKVLHAFDGADQGQISLAVGDTVHVEGEPEDGWVFGTNKSSGEQGWFPANFVSSANGDIMSLRTAPI